MLIIDVVNRRNAPQLRLVHIISHDKFEFQRNNPKIRGLSSNPATGELFLADAENGIVIVLSALEAEARAVIAYRSKKPDVPTSVCFMRTTQTLLICEYTEAKSKYEPPAGFSIVALTLTGEKWIEQSRFHLSVAEVCKGRLFHQTLCKLDDSEFLFGAEGSATLWHMQLDATHHLHLLDEIVVPDDDSYREMAAIVSNGRIQVALTLCSDSLALYLLIGDRLNELSRVPLNDNLSIHVLWMSERLLLAVETEYPDASLVWELDDQLVRRK